MFNHPWPRLSDVERKALEDIRDHHPAPYMRERAAAVLKLAAGYTAKFVAQEGLLKPRKPDTVGEWRQRYLNQGLDGLQIREGRGRKPAFSPPFQEAETAKESLLHVVRRDPRAFGIEGTRWTLDAIHRVCKWLRVTTLAGIHRLLDRLKIGWKRGRQHVHSPDPDYQAKLDYIKDLKAQARASAGRVVLLYQDEFTFYRQPTLANAYEERGHYQPLAELSYRSNDHTRIVATLDALTGRVTFLPRYRVGIPELVKFYQQVCQMYRDLGAEHINIVLDNWPIHTHPDVLLALQEQQARWPYYRPKRWSTEPTELAVTKYKDLKLPIQLVLLPTYASWCNPIEKLWRKLQQELLHLHRLADDFSKLRQEVNRFLHNYADGSLDLLRYVGLFAPD